MYLPAPHGAPPVVTEFWRRCKETTPAELIALAFTLASLGLALVAYLTATNASSDQARFQQEQSAPVLTLGTPEAERGKIVTVTTDFASVVKRADRLLLDRKAKLLRGPDSQCGSRHRAHRRAPDLGRRL